MRVDGGLNGQIGASPRYNATVSALVEEAHHRGLTIERLNWRGAMIIRSESDSAWIFGTITDRTSHLGVMMSADKTATKARLEASGIRVPAGRLATDAQDAVAFWRQCGGPVVLKPGRHSQGRGVRTGLAAEVRVRSGYDHAAAQGGPVLVEQHVAGRDLRLLVVDRRMVAAVERVPPYLVGDGTTDVRTLLAALNADRIPGTGNRLKPVVPDPCMAELLAHQGLSLDAVPAAGRIVALRSIASFSRGATPRDVTKVVAPGIKAVAEAAAAAVGLDVCGVDMIVPDLDRLDGAAVIEVNASPGLGLHAAAGSTNAAAAILDYLLPDSALN